MCQGPTGSVPGAYGKRAGAGEEEQEQQQQEQAQQQERQQPLVDLLELLDKQNNLNPDFDFVLATVGATRQETTERIDMFLNGFRPLQRTPSDNAFFSCGRYSMWGTSRVYAANQ